MRIGLFEDGEVDSLFPLTLMRPTFELRCGMTTLMAKITRGFLEQRTLFFLRDHLVPVFLEKAPNAIVNDLNSLIEDDVFIANGRWLPNPGEVSIEGEEEVAFHKGSVVYVRAKKDTLTRALSGSFVGTLERLVNDLGRREINTRMIKYTWDLIGYNRDAIVEDFRSIRASGSERLGDKVTVVGDLENIYVHPTAQLHPQVVLDASAGPIFIDESARIYPFTRIEGPCYIGKGTWIVRGNIREETSVGPFCRIGGEVEASIIHGYTNKYHTGFLGHAYVCEWVNIGALTTNSDLKNDYSSVDVPVNGLLVDTGETKVGGFIGDHTKFGIGCLLNTGAVIDVACVILGGEVLPKYIPSFCWYAGGRYRRGSGLRRTVEAEKRVMSRRGVTMSDSYVNLLGKIYQDSKEQRETLIRKSDRARSVE